MSKIVITTTIDLAEGISSDAAQTVRDVLAGMSQGVTLGDTAGTSRTAAWEIARPDGSPVLSLDAVIETYLASGLIAG